MNKHRVELIFKEDCIVFVLLQVSVNKIIYTAIYIKQRLCVFEKIHEENTKGVLNSFFFLLIFTQHKRSCQTAVEGKLKREL